MIVNQKILMLSFSLAVIFSGITTSEAQDNKDAAQKFPLAVLIEMNPRLEVYLKVRRSQVSELAIKYGRVLDTGMNKSADAGDLKTTDAFQKEKLSLEKLKKSLAVTPDDPVSAVLDNVTLPDLPSGTPEALVGLRKIWTTEWQKIRGKLDTSLQQSLKKLESDLTKGRKIEHAKIVYAYRESLLSSNLVATAGLVTTKKLAVPSPGATGAMADKSLAIATKEKPFENSIKMRFVPVLVTGGPTDAQTVFFSIWETRVKDYEKFVRDDRDLEWRTANFKQKDDHPAVQVSWQDAEAFCAWLTESERKMGKLGKDKIYRLPTDHEWSCAVGIGKEEDAMAAPMLKNKKLVDVYLWGRDYPPKNGVGNFNGQETKRNPIGKTLPVRGYNDKNERTSSVGSFEANEQGLYDMGGNVWEWCHDLFDPSNKDRRVLRGACWNNSRGINLLASNRLSSIPDSRNDGFGFRIVIADVADGPLK